MKKIISLIAVVALITLLVMPYINGRVAEEATQHLTQQVNADSLQYGQIEMKHYDRGLRSTNYRFKWTPSEGTLPLVNEPLEFDCVGNHGVIRYSYECTILDVKAYTEFVNEYLAGYDPLTIGGDVSMFGTITQSVNLSSFEMIDREGELIKFEPGRLSVSMDKNLTTFDIDGVFEGVTAKGVNGQLSLGNVEIGGNVRTNQHNLVIGDIELKLNSISLSSEKDGNAVMNGLVMSSQTQEQGENIALVYALAIDGFERSNTTQDGGEKDLSLTEGDVETLSLINLQGEFEVAGANMLQVAKLTESFQSMSRLPEDEKNAAMLTLFPRLESLFKTGLSLSVNSSADFKSEEVSANANIALVGDLTFGDFVLISVNPQSFFSKFKASLKANLPQSLLDANPNLSGALEQNPLYSKTERGYTADMKLQENEVSLNGQAMSIEELLSVLTQAAP